MMAGDRERTVIAPYVLFFAISATSVFGLTKTLTGSHASSTNLLLYGLSFYTASLAYIARSRMLTPRAAVLASNPLLIITGPVATRTAFPESVFPMAKVVMVLPSEYYSRPEDLENCKQLVGSLFGQVAHDFDDMATIDASGVSLGEQSPYPVFGYVCDSHHHANQIGLAFRTQDLCARLDAS